MSLSRFVEFWERNYLLLQIVESYTQGRRNHFWRYTLCSMSVDICPHSTKLFLILSSTHEFTEIRRILREELFATLDRWKLYTRQSKSFFKIKSLQYVRWIFVLLVLNCFLMPLFFLMEEIILKKRKGAVEPLKKEASTMCYVITFEARPWLFVSSLRLGVSVHLHRYFASRRLIDFYQV